jgi:hypothetical protein
VFSFLMSDSDEDKINGLFKANYLNKNTRHSRQLHAVNTFL